MSAISGFLAAMAPFMAMSVPIYAVVRLLMLIRRKQTVNWHHEAGLFLFVIFAAGLASQTVIPQIVCGSDGISVSMSGRSHETWLIPFRFICYTYEDMVVRHSFYSLLINILGNIVMFMPFGFFFPLLWRISGKKAVAAGFLISLSIELIQLMLPRSTDIDDLILNTAGAALGLLIYSVLHKYGGAFMDRFSSPEDSSE